MSSASPGGVHISSAKKRRLAVLDASSKNAADKKRGRGGSVSNPQKPQQKSQYAGPVSSLGQSSASAGAAGQSFSQEGNEQQYAALAASVAHGHFLKGLKPQNFQGSMSVDTLLEAAVHTSPCLPDARAAIASRVHNKVFLLDNPTAALTTKPKHRKHHKRYSGQLAGSKKRPALGTNHKYSNFAPLHKLWQQYMDDLLKSCHDREARILAADLHGCNLQVTQAANPRHVGLTGIVIRETAATFTIITQRDIVQYIPKHKSVFCFNVDEGSKVTLLGSNLQRGRSNA